MNPHNNPNVLSLESVDSAESWRELSALIKEASNPSNPTEDQRRIRKALDVIEGLGREIDKAELPGDRCRLALEALGQVEHILTGPAKSEATP
jgi:hypothetical protein